MTKNTDIRQYVKQKTTKKSIIGRVLVLIAVAAVLILLSRIPALQSYMLILSLGIVFISSAFMRNFSSEYEYHLGDEDFFIDCIYGVSKHKELFSFPLSDISGICEENNRENPENTRDFSSPLSEFSPVLIKLSNGSGVILSLNEELKNALRGRIAE